jgi:hypothetical protein
MSKEYQFQYLKIKYLSVILDWLGVLTSNLKIHTIILKSKLAFYTCQMQYLKISIKTYLDLCNLILGLCKTIPISNNCKLFNSSFTTLSLLYHDTYPIPNFKMTKVKPVNQLTTKHYTKFYSKLQTHFNLLIAKLASNSLLGNPTRRFKRKWCPYLLND